MSPNPQKPKILSLRTLNHKPSTSHDIETKQEVPDYGDSTTEFPTSDLKLLNPKTEQESCMSLLESCGGRESTLTLGMGRGSIATK